MKNLWVVIDIGCIECGVGTDILGIFTSKQDAENTAGAQRVLFPHFREGGEHYVDVLGPFDVKKSIEICNFHKCTKEATTSACEQDKYNIPGVEDPKPGNYCEEHAGKVATKSNPEYDVRCPNCNCWFGVN